MSLTLTTISFQETRRQQIIDHLDHLSCLSVSLQQLLEQKRLLRDKKNALFEQLHLIAEQQQKLVSEETTFLQEEVAILAQLCALHKRRG